MTPILALLVPVAAGLAFLAGRRVEAAVWASHRNAYHRSLTSLIGVQAAQRKALADVVAAVDDMAATDHTMSTDATELIYAAMLARKTLTPVTVTGAKP